MIITKEQARDLSILIAHVRQDISYGEGGTYGILADDDSPDFDREAIAATQRAIELLTKKIKYRVGNFEAGIKA